MGSTCNNDNDYSKDNNYSNDNNENFNVIFHLNIQL